MPSAFSVSCSVGGSVPVIFTYFVEFLPTPSRGPYMVRLAAPLAASVLKRSLSQVYLAAFWMIGSILTAGLVRILMLSCYLFGA